MNLKKWPMENKKILMKTPVLNLVSFETKLPHSNKDYTFYRLECRNWVNVLPITSNGDVILVAQFRAGVEEITVEIPGGLLESNENPQEAAVRELEEETGYTTAVENITPLGYVWPNPAIQNNCCYLFLAEKVAQTSQTHWDPTEELEIIRMPYQDFLNKIRNNEIKNGLVLNAIMKYELLRQK